jgi:protein-tyrosine phosphatase
MIYALAVDVLRDMKKIAGSTYNPAKTDLLMNVLYPGQNLNVPDPWYGGEDGYHEVYRMISLACDGIVKERSSLHPTAGLD